MSETGGGVRRLIDEHRQRLPARAMARFREIDGSSLGGLVSLQLFTTVIPLIILGFSYLSGFAENASPGVLITRELGLVRPLSDWVRDAFGNASGLRRDWTILGLGGFLLWGIPMSMTIAGIWAKAWRRAPFGWRQGLGRGALWFLLYLVMVAVREFVAFGGDHSGPVRVLLFAVGLVPAWIFWAMTPLLLVRDGGRGARYLARAGLAGVVIDGIVIPLVARLVFPIILRSWEEFGPMGVAMTLLIWAGVIGTGWVLTACISAVLWEDSEATAEPVPGAEPG
ncbi:hypothetical protein MINS_34070 [Mycolicibacterium insubricum]|uniref:hypothetical protein n=2 Tax=Mycolicibacterium insubricum TaxID=444597 RepID=UPI00138C282C|nr:hypothetical protein [Mycolicibacterium insubricum]BBZ67978.1 hypothetical protein MINS_34070 [Mycolicibacterium insubricum]